MRRRIGEEGRSVFLEEGLNLSAVDGFFEGFVFDCCGWRRHCSVLSCSVIYSIAICETGREAWGLELRPLGSAMAGGFWLWLMAGDCDVRFVVGLVGLVPANTYKYCFYIVSFVINQIINKGNSNSPGPRPSKVERMV